MLKNFMHLLVIFYGYIGAVIYGSSQKYIRIQKLFSTIWVL